jgi:HD-GYP domain-containing protein (c-di-GMP phosphodiesterase class II)
VDDRFAIWNQGVIVIEQTHENVADLLWTDQSASSSAHGDAVAARAERTALTMGFKRLRAARVGLAGTLHDIGKTMISDEILEKPGALNAREWAQVRLHPVVGQQILLGEGLCDIARWVRSHHERYDGLGYPDRLAAAEIPVEARILAVSDAYDAMVCERPYKRAIDPIDAKAELRAESGAQFDPRVVDAFIESLERHTWTDRINLGCGLSLALV